VGFLFGTFTQRRLPWTLRRTVPRLQRGGGFLLAGFAFAFGGAGQFPTPA
jgi:hypothetical protein